MHKSIIWNEQKNKKKTFEELKRLISNSSLMNYDNPTETLILESDTLELSLESMLMQAES